MSKSALGNTDSEIKLANQNAKLIDENADLRVKLDVAISALRKVERLFYNFRNSMLASNPPCSTVEKMAFDIVHNALYTIDYDKEREDFNKACEIAKEKKSV